MERKAEMLNIHSLIFNWS